MPERIWRVRVLHIVDAIEKIIRYTSGSTFEEFQRDERTVDAVIRNFLIIGEAARHVPSTARADFPDVPWRLMESMRHILVHEYEGVRLDIVWRTVVDDLPPLLYKLRKILTPA